MERKAKGRRKMKKVCVFLLLAAATVVQIIGLSVFCLYLVLAPARKTGGFFGGHRCPFGL
jgi:hypothetical protein